MLASALGADIMTGFLSPASFDPEREGFRGNFITLMRPILIKRWRHMFLKWCFLFRTDALKNYDIVIFSGDCLSAVRNIKAGAKTVYYCHTPPRYMFDQSEAYAQSAPSVIKSLQNIVIGFFRSLYLRDLAQMQIVLSNSHNIAERLERCTTVKSDILYPSVADQFFDTNSLSIGGEIFNAKEYYFCYARLSRLKRVDRIIEAFEQMPDKNFIFTYRQNDPEKLDMLARIRTSPNIQAVLSPDDPQLIALIRSSIATIYIPVNEDFGISPIESMGCGIPVIGVNEGGLKETIIHGKTGLMISEGAPLNELIAGIREMTPQYAASLEQHCIDRAHEFSYASFAQEARNKIIGLPIE